MFIHQLQLARDCLFVNIKELAKKSQRMGKHAFITEK
jgi:hypothetical protein